MIMSLDLSGVTNRSEIARRVYEAARNMDPLEAGIHEVIDNKKTGISKKWVAMFLEGITGQTEIKIYGKSFIQIKRWERATGTRTSKVLRSTGELENLLLTEIL
jgi:hypothetical protein